LPAVISGSRWPGIENLPCIDENSYGRGRLLAEYLLKKGHKTIAFFTRDDMFTSDHELLDAIRDTIDEAGLRLRDFTFRSLPLKPFIIQQTARELLQKDNPPTAFICREKILALNVKKVIPPSSDIVMVDFFEAPHYVPLFPYTRSAIRPEKQGEIIGKMLIEMATTFGSVPDDFHEDVELVVPD